jgi:spermidine synthase
MPSGKKKLKPCLESAPALAPATISEADGVRYLHLGTPWVQGAMRMRRPQALELAYIQRMMAWMLLRPTPALTQGHTVQLGLGAAAITRYCHSNLGMHCTAVEINASVIDACRLWFHLPADSPRMHTLHMDAADFVMDATRTQTVDVLCVDLYDHDAANPALDDDAFYRSCHQLLKDHGVMSVNLFGRDASFERSTRRIAAAFGAEKICSLRPTREGNTVVLALKNSTMPTRETLAERADHIESHFKLPAKKWLRMLKKPGVSEPPSIQ